jgi:hypothetical protein
MKLRMACKLAVGRFLRAGSARANISALLPLPSTISCTVKLWYGASVRIGTQEVSVLGALLRLTFSGAGVS